MATRTYFTKKRNAIWKISEPLNAKKVSLYTPLRTKKTVSQCVIPVKNMWKQTIRASSTVAPGTISVLKIVSYCYQRTWWRFVFIRIFQLSAEKKQKWRGEWATVHNIVLQTSFTRLFLWVVMWIHFLCTYLFSRLICALNVYGCFDKCILVFK